MYEILDEKLDKILDGRDKSKNDGEIALADIFQYPLLSCGEQRKF